MPAALTLAKSGRLFIHPFDDVSIMAGQGTIALEILEDLPDVDTIIAPVGGGGLDIRGWPLAAKSINPSIKIVGVQAEVCASATSRLENRPANIGPSRCIPG